MPSCRASQEKRMASTSRSTVWTPVCCELGVSVACVGLGVVAPAQQHMAQKWTQQRAGILRAPISSWLPSTVLEENASVQPPPSVVMSQ